MTPKEKAKELFERYENAAYNYLTNTGDGVEIVMLAKQSAIIAVEEILNIGCVEVPYWQQVKQEIKAL